MNSCFWVPIIWTPSIIYPMCSQHMKVTLFDHHLEILYRPPFSRIFSVNSTTHPAAVPWLRQSVAIISLQRPGFNPMPTHVDSGWTEWYWDRFCCEHSHFWTQGGQSGTGTGFAVSTSIFGLRVDRVVLGQVLL